jgi:hypothetical protein
MIDQKWPWLAAVALGGLYFATRKPSNAVVQGRAPGTIVTVPAGSGVPEGLYTILDWPVTGENFRGRLMTLRASDGAMIATPSEFVISKHVVKG